MVDYVTASEAVMFLIGFFTSSLMWAAFCIMCFRKNHEEALKLARPGDKDPPAGALAWVAADARAKLASL